MVDGPDDRRVFRRFLQLHGFEIQECDTLEEAISMVPEFLPDLVVTDLSRATDPALGRCRSLIGDLPVLFHGGLFSEWEASGRVQASKSAFLARPFSLLDFHLTIQGLLKS
ncbi:response regulator [Holophaga foetida]|uniref:response regulator n=1 Tax=Holophaga foetida TaxID=35839 RepID=UPI0011DCA468|nr:response regulator [Holophaga foetida]